MLQLFYFYFISYCFFCLRLSVVDDCLFVCFSQFCQTCVKEKRIEDILVFNINKFKFTVAIHSCMSFEALKPICMHEIVKFFLLLYIYILV